MVMIIAYLFINLFRGILSNSQAVYRSVNPVFEAAPFIEAAPQLFNLFQFYKYNRVKTWKYFGQNL